MFAFVLFAISSTFARDDSIARIGEKLATDKNFYDQWMSLIQLQASQLEEQTLDFPLTSVARDLDACGREQPHEPFSADYIRPNDISLYAEMGHLSTYCKANYTNLKAGELDLCEEQSWRMGFPTLSSMFRQWNPNLRIVDSNDYNDFLPEQARSIADGFKQFDGWQNAWKMVLILPSIQDGEASETGQTAIEVLDAIDELAKAVPERTLVVAIRTSGSGIWQDASHSHVACHDMLARWKTHTRYNYNSVWDQVEAIVAKNFERDNFRVEILPLLREARLQSLPTELIRNRFCCAHFSERGLSLLHLSIWNQLMTKTQNRTYSFRPTPSSANCPDPRCPFIRTSANSEFCIHNSEASDVMSVAPQWIVLAVLVVCVLLTLLVLCCICRDRARRWRKTPPKAFGNSLSSIKFIDEDDY